MDNWQEIISTASAVWGLFGGAVTRGAVRVNTVWARHSRLGRLRRAAGEDAVAICVRVGGRSDPLPDVVQYLKRNHPQIRTVLVYSAPVDAALDDPATAEAIIEDLREAIAEFGAQSLNEVHLFWSGMIAYPFALGALLGNWCPVVIYHLRGDGRYVPLYRLTKEWLQEKNRRSRALARLQVQPLQRAPGGGRPLSPAPPSPQEPRAGVQPGRPAKAP